MAAATEDANLGASAPGHAAGGEVADAAVDGVAQAHIGDVLALYRHGNAHAVHAGHGRFPRTRILPTSRSWIIKSSTTPDVLLPRGKRRQAMALDFELRFGGDLVWRKRENGIESPGRGRLEDADFLLCASLHNHVCAESSVIGFSIMTCLPCASNCLAMSKCVVVGVTMLSASEFSAASAMELKMRALCFAPIFFAVSTWCCQ